MNEPALTISREAALGLALASGHPARRKARGPTPVCEGAAPFARTGVDF